VTGLDRTERDRTGHDKLKGTGPWERMRVRMAFSFRLLTSDFWLSACTCSSIFPISYSLFPYSDILQSFQSSLAANFTS